MSANAMPEACPFCGCLAYRLVNTSLHLDAPDGAVLCTKCGKGYVRSTDERGLIREPPPGFIELPQEREKVERSVQRLRASIAGLRVAEENFRDQTRELDAMRERAEAAESERDAIGAALGEPCAECGHIDWRSDGYAENLVASAAGWLDMVYRIATRGPGPDTSAEEALATIAHYAKAKLDALRTAGKP